MTNEQHLDRLEGKVDKILTILLKDSSPPFQTLKKNERRYILEALKYTNWRIKGTGGAAELLGIPPSTLCFHFPQQHQRRIRTTNLLERLNREIKRRADVVQIFPNEKACERLIGALCMEWSDEWITGRRYLDMTDWK